MNTILIIIGVVIALMAVPSQTPAEFAPECVVRDSLGFTDQTAFNEVFLMPEGPSRFRRILELCLDNRCVPLVNTPVIVIERGRDVPWVKVTRLSERQLLWVHQSQIVCEDDGISGSLILAIKNARASEVRELLRQNALKLDSYRPLVVAASMGDVKLLKMLTDAGASVNPTGSSMPFAPRRSPLVVSAARGHFEAVKFLLGEGAQVDGGTAGQLADEWYYLALNSMRGAQGEPDSFEEKYGVAKGDPRIVGLILDKGGQVNNQSERGKTLLMVASAAGFYDVVELLLKRGAKVDIQDENGTTALMMAAERNQPEVVSILLKYGANPTLKNHDGETAIELSADDTIEAMLRKAAQRK